VHVDWDSFTPWSALAGGVLIGAAALVFALLAGRIAGISGIVGGLVRARRGDVGWRAAFIAGLLAVPALYTLVGPGFQMRLEASTVTLLAGGLLVGFGTRLGGGCTSGHGVCGLARRSPRSLVATLTFMVAGMLTVAVARHAFVP
jgi:uncharacterized membrane protein YedE/YeeE